MKEADLPVGPGRPLLPAQTDVGWSSLPVSAHVAGIWLKNLLRAGGAASHDVIGYVNHSCTATLLSWAAKYGLDANTRASWAIIRVEQVVQSWYMPGTPWLSPFEI